MPTLETLTVFAVTTALCSLGALVYSDRETLRAFFARVVSGHGSAEKADPSQLPLEELSDLVARERNLLDRLPDREPYQGAAMQQLDDAIGKQEVAIEALKRLVRSA